MAETVQPLDEFETKTGNRIFKTCSTCRTRKQDNRVFKRKSHEAEVPEPPVQETHVPHFMRPTTSSPRCLAPQRISSQQFQQQFQEQGTQQSAASSPAPSHHRRGFQFHRAARRASEDVPPTQELDVYLARQ
ncbi:hypothetical protein TSTA_104050 [Talaromyces stipitatus ATCC 10500]|uniref:Uncharacterized protein n=1 Tax=Talaromyces stipitatus (strain ATCC 10500 / CBS 375.48 / QM 6759 / NRRL 1006) TaxID=441959 RepID=B8MNU6_TALSN|nr:uncharacterized protein TSTA_104050 [Talaromyces stipitatus ATCC 10500]EED14185.1 hypothetical protein TSTA_104050 [Talaromyces stipitatus ATCC 10500]